MSTPWKKTQSISIANAIGKSTLLEETRCAIQKTNFTKVATCSKKGNLDLQHKGNFEDDEKNSKRVQCNICNMDLVAGTTFTVSGATTNQLVKRTSAARSNFAVSRFRLHPSSHAARDTTSKSERQQQQHGKAKDQ